MTSRSSMKLMIRMIPRHFGQVRGSIFPDQVGDRLRSSGSAGPSSSGIPSNFYRLLGRRLDSTRCRGPRRLRFLSVFPGKHYYNNRNTGPSVAVGGQRLLFRACRGCWRAGSKALAGGGSWNHCPARGDRTSATLAHGTPAPVIWGAKPKRWGRQITPARRKSAISHSEYPASSRSTWSVCSPKSGAARRVPASPSLNEPK